MKIDATKPRNIIRTSKQENPFVMIDHRPLNDSNLSWQAKGLLAYLLSKPDNWEVIVADLEKRATNGRDSVKSILNELETKGYIERHRIRDEATGRFSHMETIVYEMPQKHMLEPQAENPLVDDSTTSGFSVSGKSTRGKSTAGESDPNNNDCSNNDKNNNDKTNKGKVVPSRLLSTFEIHFERPPSPTESRTLTRLADLYGVDMLDAAFTEYAIQTDLQEIQVPLRYIEGVLRNWEVEGMRLTDVIEHLERMKRK